MRRFARYLLPTLLLLLLPALTACDSDESSDSSSITCDTSGDRVVTARVDSEAFCAPVSNATLAFGQIFLTAPSADAQQVISFGFPAAVNTHSLRDVATYVPVATGSVSYEATSGTVTVTDVSSERVRGTFEFTGQGRDLTTGEATGGSVSVTEGRFNVPFQDFR